MKIPYNYYVSFCCPELDLCDEIEGLDSIRNKFEFSINETILKVEKEESIKREDIKFLDLEDYALNECIKTINPTTAHTIEVYTQPEKPDSFFIQFHIQKKP